MPGLLHRRPHGGRLGPVHGEAALARFVAEAERLGFGGVQAVPLRLGNQVVGGLNVFTAPDAWLTADDREIADALARLTALVLLQKRSADRAAVLTEQLQTALLSRVVIEQAKGVLAEHGGLPMEQAFRVLRLYARNNNKRLTELAEQVVEGRVDLGVVVAAATDARLR